MSSFVSESPSWSPDGKKLAIVNPTGSAPHIWVMNADGSNRVQLTNGGGERDPAWSKDGNSIFYAATDFGETVHRIERINIDGSNKTVIVNDTRDSRYPTSSADGSRIAFSSLIPGTARYSIQILTVVGGARSVLISNDSSNIRPAWSIENTIAYESVESSGNSKIYTIFTDGTGISLLQVGNPQYSVGSPSWSPDGRRIAMWVSTPGTSSRLMGIWRTGNLFTTYNIPLSLDVSFVAWSPFIR